MSVSIDETSFLYIVLTRWAPGLITVAVSGFAASFLIPKLQKKSQRTAQLEEKRIALAEEIITAFNRYIVSWRRLIQIAKYEQTTELTDDEQKRKSEFVSDRNTRRDALIDKLLLCKLYFCTSTCGEIARFITWDEAQSVKALEDLPPLEDWRAHETNIVGLIRNEIA